MPWLLSRACAGDWPYEPQWIRQIRHPSLRHRFEQISRVFVIPDFGDRTVQVAVEVIRLEARKTLENREVKHFEVFPIRNEGLKAVPHRQCGEGGCDMCSGLGMLFTPDEGSVANLIGWSAVMSRVA